MTPPLCIHHGSPSEGGGRAPPEPHPRERRPGVGPGSGLTRPGPSPGSALTARGRADSLWASEIFLLYWYTLQSLLTTERIRRCRAGVALSTSKSSHFRPPVCGQFMLLGRAVADIACQSDAPRSPARRSHRRRLFQQPCASRSVRRTKTL